MKKPLLLIPLVVAVAVAAFYLSQKKQSNSAANSTAPATEQQNETTKTVGRTTPPSITVPVTDQALKGFQKNDVIARLRAGIAAQDGAAMDAAYQDLIKYFEAHPEQAAEYVEFMRTEKEEQVLRMFALAMAASESGLVANEEIIKAAMELAKDGSFEQRQHIMLHLMSNFEMRDDVFESIYDISKNDANSQVKTSSVVVLADWMERFPDKADQLLARIGDIFKSAQEEDVRDFTYQVLALHKEQLTRDMHVLLQERLASEPDSYSANLIASALFAAPDDIRLDALTKTQTTFNAEADPERKRNLLLQLVCLSRGDIAPLLQQLSSGDSPLALDARDYLALVSNGGPFDPHDVLVQKSIRDGSPVSCADADHKH